MFPRSRVMNRYYNTDFDYSSAQSVQSIGTSAYIVRRSTWEQIGMFDERFGQFMVDLAYNFTLQRQGFPVYYTPCAEIVHYGSRSIRQNPVAALRDETEAFILFNQAYAYFKPNWLFQPLVRAALRVRLFLRLMEHRIRTSNIIEKGPVASYSRQRTESMAVRSSEEF